MSNTQGQRVKNMLEDLKRWQTIEDHSIDQTTKIGQQPRTEFVRIIMEVIRHDSEMHRRVQQTIIDSLTRADIPLTYEDLAEVWDQIEKHDATERKVVEIAKNLHASAWSPIHKALLSYLVTDEEKHDRLLEQLSEIKQDLSRRTQ